MSICAADRETDKSTQHAAQLATIWRPHVPAHGSAIPSADRSAHHPAIFAAHEYSQYFAAHMPAIVIADKSAQFSAYVRAKRSAHNAAFLGTQRSAFEPAKWSAHQCSFLHVIVAAIFAAVDATFHTADSKAIDAYVAAIQYSECSA